MYNLVNVTCPEPMPFAVIDNYFSRTLKMEQGHLPQFRTNTDDFEPATLTSLVTRNQGLNMEHMSFSGITNAHSAALVVDYMIYTRKLIPNTNGIIKNVDVKKDVFLGYETNFTQGGFNQYYFPNMNEYWYGWGGWGGSILLFSPRYEATVAFTVTSFDLRPLFGRFAIETVVMYCKLMIDEHRQRLKEEKLAAKAAGSSMPAAQRKAQLEERIREAGDQPIHVYRVA